MGTHRIIAINSISGRLMKLLIKEINSCGKTCPYYECDHCDHPDSPTSVIAMATDYCPFPRLCPLPDISREEIDIISIRKFKKNTKFPGGKGKLIRSLVVKLVMMEVNKCEECPHNPNYHNYQRMRAYHLTPTPTPDCIYRVCPLIDVYPK